jgi:hypothetical protein
LYTFCDQACKDGRTDDQEGIVSIDLSGVCEGHYFWRLS